MILKILYSAYNIIYRNFHTRSATFCGGRQGADRMRQCERMPIQNKKFIKGPLLNISSKAQHSVEPRCNTSQSMQNSEWKILYTSVLERYCFRGCASIWPEIESFLAKYTASTARLNDGNTSDVTVTRERARQRGPGVRMR